MKNNFFNRQFNTMKYLTLLPLLFLLNCSPTKEKTESAETTEAHLGEVHLEITAAEAAIPLFTKGLLLLHSFEYDDARKAFQEAKEVDSTCVMAYWGEAMTYNHPLWRRQMTDKARAVLEDLGESPEERLAMAGTELEKDFLQATEILFGAGDDKFARNQAYSDHLGEMLKKYPDHQEVAAFYALSCLGAVKVGRDEDAYEKGARIAQGVIEENPNHPGALHYLIHSYDDPYHAHKALTAANSYSKVAPDAAHALHMPSHIYVALGMWNEVISSNIASWDASIKRKEAKDLGNDAQSYHALHWLMYGYLQKGQFEKAKQLVKDMVVYTDTLSSTRARDYLIGMKANYLIESNDWDTTIANIIVDLDELNITSEATYAFLEGMKAFKNKDEEELQTIILAMKQAREKAEQFVSSDGVPMCSASTYPGSPPNQLDIDKSYVQELELMGLLAAQQEDETAAAELFSKAAELEESISYSYGPPSIPYPSFELYGDWLLEWNRPAEAKIQFEKALKKGPKRMRALKGLLNVAKQMGEEKEVERINGELEEIMKIAGNYQST